MLQQPRDPLAIFDVGLPPRHRLDVRRVDEKKLEGPLQDLIDRPPVDASALHRDVRTHPAAASQSASRSNSRVVVPQVRISSVRVAFGPGSRRQAATVFLCTSSPQQTW
jgi:hypothetical protein